MLNRKGEKNLEIFNLGTGNGYSVLEVINSFEKTTGQKLNYIVVDRRPGDITEIWADTNFANKELGWKAEKGIDEMTNSAWKWELALESRKKS
jgi:UDP-glucose 4-epimerase